MEEDLKELKERVDTIEKYLKIKAKDNLEEKIVERLKEVYSKNEQTDLRKLAKRYKQAELTGNGDDGYAVDGMDLNQMQGIKMSQELNRLGFDGIQEAAAMSNEEMNRRLDQKVEEWKSQSNVDGLDKARGKMEQLIEEEYFTLDEGLGLQEMMNKYEEIMEELDKLDRMM